VCVCEEFYFISEKRACMSVCARNIVQIYCWHKQRSSISHRESTQHFSLTHKTCKIVIIVWITLGYCFLKRIPLGTYVITLLIYFPSRILLLLLLLLLFLSFAQVHVCVASREHVDGNYDYFKGERCRASHTLITC
jgi:hypothetical protein